MHIQNTILRLIASLISGGLLLGLSVLALYFKSLAYRRDFDIFIPGAMLLWILLAGIFWSFFGGKKSQNKNN